MAHPRCFSRRVAIAMVLALGASAFVNLPAFAQLADPLPSWNDGATKQSITAFMARITQPGGADYVQPVDRIAVFDNDGTLWSEQPMYVQIAFAIDRVKAMAPLHPEWKDQQPYKAALEGDAATLAATDPRDLADHGDVDSTPG